MDSALRPRRDLRPVLSSFIGMTIFAGALALAVLFGSYNPNGPFISDAIAGFTLLIGVARNFLFDLASPPESIILAFPQTWRGEDWIGRLDQSGAAPQVYSRFILAGIAGLVAGSIVAISVWVRTMPMPKIRLVDGPLPRVGRPANRLAKRALAASVREHGSDIELAPGVPLSRDREIRSMMILGAQRSGKTVVLRFLMRQLRETGAKAVIHDTKGDVTSAWPDSNAILLAPQDKRSWAWDIARDLRGRLGSAEFAAALIPPDKDSDWQKGAQLILVALITALQRTHGEAWGWRELYEIFRRPDAEISAIVSEHDPTAASLVVVDEEGNFTKNAVSYKNSLISPVLQLLEPLAAAWGDIDPQYRISVRDWLSDENTTQRVLILQRMPDFPNTSRLWMSAILTRMIAITGGANFPDSSTRRIWFVLDEFTQLGKIPALFDVPATHASKGVFIAVALQSLAYAQEVYGERAKDLLATMTGTKIILKLEAGADAKYVAEELIDMTRYQELQKVSRSDAEGKSKTVWEWKNQEKRLLMSSGFAKLGPRRGGVHGVTLGLDDGNPYELFWPFETWPSQRPGSVRANWVDAVPPQQEE